MADLSDESDVNPSEMARMVDDLDDLDNTLLGGSSNKQEPYSIAKKDTDTTDVKKKVAFKVENYELHLSRRLETAVARHTWNRLINLQLRIADFDTEDPLADLLSDDDASYETKKPVVTNAKSNLVADLFGVRSSKPEDKITEPQRANTLPEVKKIDTINRNIDIEENLPLSINKKSSSTISSQGFSVTQNIRDKSQSNEAIASRTEDRLKSSNAKTRKTSLMEDLFGTKARSIPNKEIDNRPSLSTFNVQNPSHPVSVLAEPSKPEQSTKSFSSDYNMDSGTVREPRRGRKNSPVISDPLGLFSAPKQIEPVVRTITDIEKKADSNRDMKLPNEDLPEWLGGAARGKETRLEKPEIHSEKLSEEIAVKSSLAAGENTREFRTDETTLDTSRQKNHEPNIFYPDVSGMMSTQFDQQAALITMQQQEHELKTAATLSHQNEQVRKIVENQKAKLDEQAKMFNVLIKHQLDRQSMLETQMKMQQARIDHYIQTLMSLPTALPNGVFTEEKSAKKNEKEEKEESTSPEALLKKLDLEKVNLENTVEILRENHEKEITILQESYEKQMLLLRRGVEKLEKRTCEDCASLEQEHERRILRMKKEKDEMEQTYDEEIDRLKKREKLFIEDLYDRHSHGIELLRKEHEETINEISRAKEIERNAIDTINNRKTDLDDLLKRSQLVIEHLQKFQKTIEERNEEFDETRGNYLRKQEESLQLLRDQLKLQQDSTTEERKRLLEISQRLDVGTAELTAEFKKNRSSINETEERLAARERALVREKQLFDEQMKWEREHLQVIKEAWTKEQERQMKMIFDEREAVVNERAKLDIFIRLKNGSEDMLKAELDVALRTAQEATNEANQGKHKWQEKCHALDLEKRSIREKEKHLVQRAKELESLTQSALTKREEGLRALKEAKRIEQRHKEHLARLQNQLENLANRENRKTTEKLASARERIAAKIYSAEKPEKDIVERPSPTHCVNEMSLMTNSQISTHFKDVVDPHLLLLKLNLDNKLDTTDDLLAAMQVIGQ